MVAGPWVTVDAECLAAWRWVVSEFEEETRPSLIQTERISVQICSIADLSSKPKHGPMVGDGRSLRCADIFDPGSVIERHCEYEVFSNRFSYVRLGSLAFG